MVILSRSFCNFEEFANIEEFEKSFSKNMDTIREFERKIRQLPSEAYESNYRELQMIVKDIVEKTVQ